MLSKLLNLSVLGLGVSSKHLVLLAPIFGSVWRRAEKLLVIPRLIVSCLQMAFHSSHITMFKTGRKERDSVEKRLLSNLEATVLQILFSKCVLKSHWSGLGYLVCHPQLHGRLETGQVYYYLRAFFLLVSLLKEFFPLTLEWFAPSFHIDLCPYPMFAFPNLLHHSPYPYSDLLFFLWWSLINCLIDTFIYLAT